MVLAELAWTAASTAAATATLPALAPAPTPARTAAGTIAVAVAGVHNSLVGGSDGGNLQQFGSLATVVREQHNRSAMCYVLQLLYRQSSVDLRPIQHAFAVHLCCLHVGSRVFSDQDCEQQTRAGFAVGPTLRYSLVWIVWRLGRHFWGYGVRVGRFKITRT